MYCVGTKGCPKCISDNTKYGIFAHLIITPGNAHFSVLVEILTKETDMKEALPFVLLLLVCLLVSAVVSPHNKSTIHSHHVTVSDNDADD